MNKAPGYFHRQIEEKLIETTTKKNPSCLIPRLIVVFIQQLEILVTDLTLTDILRHSNYYNNKLYYVLKEINQLKPMLKRRRIHLNDHALPNL